MTNETLTINVLVEGMYDEYEGNYSATIAVLDVDNEDNVYFFNNEPIFSMKMAINVSGSKILACGGLEIAKKLGKTKVSLT